MSDIIFLKLILTYLDKIKCNNKNIKMEINLKLNNILLCTTL